MRAFSRDDQPTAVWLSRAIIAGFVATGVMTMALVVAYSIAEVFGSETGDTLSRWLWGLTHNAVVSASVSQAFLAVGVHLAVGLAFAIIYARFFEPAFSGPGWTRGARFAFVPWALSVLVFLPLLGGGLLGLDLEAGPLPIIGNLILHLVYGVVLGWTYGLETGWQEESVHRGARRGGSQESSLAIGIVSGGLVGALLGWAVASAMGPDSGSAIASEAGLALVGALFGSASGAIIGPLLGMGRSG